MGVGGLSIIIITTYRTLGNVVDYKEGKIDLWRNRDVCVAVEEPVVA